MTVLESIIVYSLVAFAAITILSVVFSVIKKQLKKTKEKNEEKKIEGERKIEPAIKPKDDPTKKTDPVVQKEEEKVLEKEPPKQKESGFKIIRKQSKIKINKKALNVNSRNPSVSRVFKDGKRIDEEDVVSTDVSEETNQVVKELESEERSGVMPDITSVNPGRYGFRIQEREELNTDKYFKINAPTGSPNRAPIIGDRTNFASHLHVSKDGNLSGVVGTGVAKIIDDAETQIDDIEENTQDMIKNVKTSLFGEKSVFGYKSDSFGKLLEMAEKRKETKQQEPIKKEIDAETLIISDIINNPKFKNKK